MKNGRKWILGGCMATAGVICQYFLKGHRKYRIKDVYVGMTVKEHELEHLGKYYIGLTNLRDAWGPERGIGEYMGEIVFISKCWFHHLPEDTLVFHGKEVWRAGD